MTIVRVEVIVRVRVKSFKVFRVVEVVGLDVGVLWFWVVCVRVVGVMMVCGIIVMS